MQIVVNGLALVFWSVGSTINQHGYQTPYGGNNYYYRQGDRPYYYGGNNNNWYGNRPRSEFNSVQTLAITGIELKHNVKSQLISSLKKEMQMSQNKFNESHDPSGDAPREIAPHAGKPLNEGDPSDQDAKRRLGNFTGAGEPARQGNRNDRSGPSKKSGAGSSKRK